MSHEWISERVSVPSLKRIAKNIAFMADDAGWGPNNIFRFPGKGGTGEIFERMAKRIGEKISLGKEINHIDTRRKMVKMTGGEEDGYDLIVNTAPLDELALMLDGSPAEFRTAAGGLESNNVTVVGFGIERPNPSTRCWIYSPDPSVPFYRTTNFSHYSPFNVPGGDVERYSSLMCEKACYKVRPDPDSVAEEMINGLQATGLLEGSDEPVSVYTKVLPKAYPIRTRDRNDRLAVIDKYLKENDIYSIGRFGAWKYEVSNMDHSTMMGMDTADMLVKESIR
jgi:protoporphyrinogen oxidase